jgi:hypothetical protein
MVVLSLATFFTSLVVFKSTSKQFLPILFGIFLFTLAFPRFDYFHLVPALSILVLSAPQLVDVVLKAKPAFKLLPIIFLIPMLIFTRHYLMNNWNTEVRFFESQTVAISTFLQITGIASQQLYIQNGPDQILPITQALPIKPWADEFPWYLEINGIQEKVVASLEQQKPQFIIAKPYDAGGAYDLGVYRPEKIANYIDENYQNYFQISDILWLKIRK